MRSLMRTSLSLFFLLCGIYRENNIKWALIMLAYPSQSTGILPLLMGIPCVHNEEFRAWNREADPRYRGGYGDEIDEDFRPHIVQWKKVRKPRKLQSLANVFATDDWVRSIRHGFGKVLAVRNSSIDIRFRGTEGTFIPGPDLCDLTKVDMPEPEDTRPACEQFPPGTCVERVSLGKCLVLNVNGKTMTIPAREQIFMVMADLRSASPVNWKMDNFSLDLNRPFEQRRLWWSRHGYMKSRYWPCACCGYPIFTISSEEWERLGRCLVCGWINTSLYDVEFYNENDQVCYYGTPEYDIFDENEWPNTGYTLQGARENFEANGSMFDQGDKRMEASEGLREARNQLI